MYLSAIAELNLSPTGNLSININPVAVSGPLLVIIMVNMTSSPTLAIFLFAVLVMSMSASGMFMLALAVLFGVGSYWSVLVRFAVLVMVWLAMVEFIVPVRVSVAFSPLLSCGMVQMPVVIVVCADGMGYINIVESRRALGLEFGCWWRYQDHHLLQLL